MAVNPLEVLASTLKRFDHELKEYARGHPTLAKNPPPKVPDRLDDHTLATTLFTRFTGTPADGSLPPTQVPSKVVWVDHGDEVLVHLDSVKTKVVDGKLLVAIDLETDQTGRTPLVVTFALGGINDPAGLVAVTEQYPRGNELLASRWGEALQAAIWSGLLDLAQDHAGDRQGSPRGIAALKGSLQFHAGPRLTVS